MEFTTVNGKTATLLRTINYKNHVIEKVRQHEFVFYTVDRAGFYVCLMDAKFAIDMKIYK